MTAVPALAARATTVTVAVPPEMRSPSSQATSVPDPAQLPWLGEADMNWAPVGSWSLRCEPTATAGPALVTVIV